MALKQLQQEAHKRGFSARHVPGYREYQVKPTGTRWDGEETYFTDDIKDAFDTLIAMARCKAKGHDFEDQSVIGPDSGHEIQSCIVWGYTWSHIWY